MKSKYSSKNSSQKEPTIEDLRKYSVDLRRTLSAKVFGGPTKGKMSKATPKKG